MEMIKRGAEAEIYLSSWRGRKVVIKRRIRKKYRIEKIDSQIREQRTKREALLIISARKAGVSVPIIYDVRLQRKEIVMQYIEGERLKDVIDMKSKEWQKKICYMIGKSIANLHKNSIIHGDLTTSNMIYKNGKLYFIDFGLGSKSKEIEDMGVDLHLLMEAFKSAHRNEALFEWVTEAYMKNFENGKKVLKKVEEIAKRGRYMRRVE
ncbi:MAG: Kae1-associated kinase Bud32 [Thermoplasmata archaeon]|nr:MAG: Kae1-associated kinase Bud32 [Thermoplasmata archaeon]HDN96294.1 Kae1-associated serine/threonine protein kinase [Thermoplasmatales archaeon]